MPVGCLRSADAGRRLLTENGTSSKTTLGMHFSFFPDESKLSTKFAMRIRIRGVSHSAFCSRFEIQATMQIIETLENRKDALRVSELAKLLSVTPQHIYKTWAAGRIPGAFRVNRAIRFDPQILAEWLKRELMTTDFQVVPARRARRVRAA